VYYQYFTDRKLENGRKRKSEDAELEYVLTQIKRKKVGSFVCIVFLFINAL
jgi:hypothetical protein